MILKNVIAINLVLTSFLATLMLMGSDSEGGSVLCFVTAVAALVSLVIVDFRKIFQLSDSWMNTLIFLVIGWQLGNLFRSLDEFLAISIAQFLVYIQIILFFKQKTLKIQRQMLILSLIQAGVATVFEQNMIFAFVFFFYIIGAVSVITLLFLSEEKVYYQNNPYLKDLYRRSPDENDAEPVLKQIGRLIFVKILMGPFLWIRSKMKKNEPQETMISESSKKIKTSFQGAPGNLEIPVINRALLFRMMYQIFLGGVVALFFFFLIPRFNTENIENYGFGHDQWQSRQRNEKMVSVGFSETVQLGSLGNVAQNHKIGMFLDFFDHQTGKAYDVVKNNEVYLKGTALVDYNNGKWTAQRSTEFSPQLLWWEQQYQQNFDTPNYNTQNNNTQNYNTQNYNTQNYYAQNFDGRNFDGRNFDQQNLEPGVPVEYRADIPMKTPKYPRSDSEGQWNNNRPNGVSNDSWEEEIRRQQLEMDKKKWITQKIGQVLSSSDMPVLTPFFQSNDLVRIHQTFLSSNSDVICVVWPFTQLSSEYYSDNDEKIVYVEQGMIHRPTEEYREFECDFYTGAFHWGMQSDIIPCQEYISQDRKDDMRLLADPDRFPELCRFAKEQDDLSGIEKNNVIGRARFLEQKLKTSDRFSYQLGGIQRPRGVDPVEDFVASQPQGHCEYFAAALTLMLRSLDIPARVIVGYKFVPTERMRQGYPVLNSNAHAWVEVYLEPEQLPESQDFKNDPGLWDNGAWLRLDPTPWDSNDSFLTSMSKKYTNFFDWTEDIWKQYFLNFTPQRQFEAIYTPMKNFFVRHFQGFGSLYFWKEWLASINENLKNQWDALKNGTWGQKETRTLALELGALLLAFYLGGRFILSRKRKKNRLTVKKSKRKNAVPFYLRWENLLLKYQIQRRLEETGREFVFRAFDQILLNSAILSSVSLSNSERMSCVHWTAERSEDSDSFNITGNLNKKDSLNINENLSKEDVLNTTENLSKKDGLNQKERLDKKENLNKKDNLDISNNSGGLDRFNIFNAEEFSRSFVLEKKRLLQQAEFFAFCYERVRFGNEKLHPREVIEIDDFLDETERFFSLCSSGGKEQRLAKQIKT